MIEDSLQSAKVFRAVNFQQSRATAHSPKTRGCIKLLRSMRQGWVPISFSETKSRASAPPFLAEAERQYFQRRSHLISLSLAFVPQSAVNLNRIHEMRSSVSQFQLARTPLAALATCLAWHQGRCELAERGEGKLWMRNAFL
jgi:hypothetical protein